MVSKIYQIDMLHGRVEEWKNNLIFQDITSNTRLKMERQIMFEAKE